MFSPLSMPMRWLPRYARVMSIEDFLGAHAPDTTGAPMPAQSATNLTMTMRVKMASNDMPVAIDTSSREARAALARDVRRRMQWCMTPLGMNMLPADSLEYAELEPYLTTFDIGKLMSVPGIRH